MTALSLVASVGALLLAAHAVIFTTAAEWHLKTAHLWRTDPDQARARNRAKPWHVRYADRLS